MRSDLGLLLNLLILSPFAFPYATARRDRDRDARDQHVLLPPLPVVGSAGPPVTAIQPEYHDFVCQRHSS